MWTGRCCRPCGTAGAASAEAAVVWGTTAGAVAAAGIAAPARDCLDQGRRIVGWEGGRGARTLYLCACMWRGCVWVASCLVVCAGSGIVLGWGLACGAVLAVEAGLVHMLCCACHVMHLGTTARIGPKQGLNEATPDSGLWIFGFFPKRRRDAGSAFLRRAQF
jgi:hypothetical protein